jgi:Rps23 Pro-64 3,4-dihydroxylase Tpa1-like proline 4-hydroxylase
VKSLAPDTEARLLAARERFAAAEPFPRVVLEDFLRPECAAALADAFGRVEGEWITYHHVNERKRGFNDVSRLDAASREVIADLQSPEFVHLLEKLSGVEPLRADPELDGGGLHETEPGGFLNVHTDFLSHTTQRSWSRQLNLLLFLNRGWREEYRGWLELWDRQVSECEQRIAPLFNRAVIFRTSDVSFHGVPQGVACPPGMTRKSLALYYFRDEGSPRPLRPTRYLPRPGDPWPRRVLIALDRWAVWGYSALKRYTPIGDRVVT